MDSKGIVEFDWTLIFQVMNTLLLILVIYFVVQFIMKLSKSRKNTEESLRRIESQIDEMESRSRD